MSMRSLKRFAGLGFVLTYVFWLSGCAPQPGVVPGVGGNDAEIAAQLSTMNERLTQFDTDNRDLHTQVAQLQQMLQVSEEEKKLLKQQLTDASTELELAESEAQESEQRLASLQGNGQIRGGATIKANNSLRDRLQIIELSGVEVRLDGDVVRIELPADRLFATGTNQLQSTGMALLDQVGTAIRRHYPHQMVGIEGHTDPMTASRSVVTAHQLTATQTIAVFHHLSRTGTVPSEQMFTMGLGSNRPRFSNGEAAGRARNRRIELVIYPERYDGM